MAIGVKVAGREAALRYSSVSRQDPTIPKEEGNLQECGRISGHRFEDRALVPMGIGNTGRGTKWTPSYGNSFEWPDHAGGWKSRAWYTQARMIQSI